MNHVCNTVLADHGDLLPRDMLTLFEELLSD